MDGQRVTSSPIIAFYSYAHEDELLRNSLEKHLSSLRRQGILQEWHDRKILPGTDWSSTIDHHLTAASIILLLISPDFLASDYCYGIEMQQALQRHDAGLTHIIPIILRPVDWQGTPFSQLHCLPHNAHPVTLWSDRDEGFLDVAKGIRAVVEELWSQRATNHSSDTALLITPSSSWNIPFRRNPFFTGREEILSRLHQALTSAEAAEPQQPLALCGLGGIGKTQTAVEYTYRYRKEYKHILWVQAETRETLELDLCRSAGLLHLPEQNEKDQNIVLQAIRRWLETQRSWLLVFDNADDLKMVSDYLPVGTMGSILLTTRAQAMAGLARKIEIEEMGLQEGISFLLRRSGLREQGSSFDNITTREYLQAKEIVQEMGGLPLALDQAGAYIEETRCGLKRYLTLYHAQQTTLLKQRGGIGVSHPEPVATTWSLSFQKVEHAHPLAAEVLRLCAFLAPDAIPEEIFTSDGSALGQLLQDAVADAYTFDTAIGELLKYSLLRRDPQTSMLTIHRLVQIAVRESMDEMTQRHWAERTVQVLAHIFPEVRFENLSDCQRFLSHAQMCDGLIKKWNIDFPAATHLLNQIGIYLGIRGQYGQSLLFFQHSLTILELAPELHQLDIATALHALATAYRGQRNYGQALAFYQRALAIREHLLGAQHPDVAHTLNNLATLYAGEKLDALALPLYQRALAIREHLLGAQHPDVAHTLNNLATLYRNRKQYEKAEPLYQRALEINEQAFGPNHPYVAAVLNNLATLYRNQKHYEKAESLYQRALLIREQVPDGRHPTIASTLSNLAILYLRQDEYEKAEAFFQRALALYEELLGKEHYTIATILQEYALLLHRTNRDAEAEQVEMRANVIGQNVEHIQKTHDHEKI